MKKLICLIMVLFMTIPAFAEEAVPSVGMPNPWEESADAALLADYAFAIPEDASNVVCRKLGDLAEIQFDLDETHICFRMQETAGFTDISGCYYTWEYAEDVKIGWNDGKLYQVQDGENTVELCLWYDILPGEMYSVSAVARDLDGFDLTAVAEQVYVPLQDEANGFDFSELSSYTFEFSSGVGAWSTELFIHDDGTFNGNFHDSNMGETGEGYPNGTVYGCSFHGRFSYDEQLSDREFLLTVRELALDEGQVPEAIEDGVLYITSDPYGLVLDHGMVLYTPGCPIGELSEEAMFWMHMMDWPDDLTSLPCYFLYDREADTGFVAY